MIDKRTFVTLLSWDSRFFGYKVGKIVLPPENSTDFQLLLKDIKNDKVRLLYWFIDKNNSNLNKIAKLGAGFLVDRKMYYSKKITNTDIDIISKNIISYKNKPLNKRLLSLSLQSGIYSRYKTDPNFGNKLYEKLYTIWITDSLNAKLAKDVLIYKINNEIVGFITIETKDNTASIGLLAVDSQFRGQGIGTKLLTAAIKKSEEWGFTEIKVTTQQENISACKFYEKIGFELQQVENVYHFWL